MPAIRRLVTSDLPDCLALASSRGWNVEERTWSLLLDVGDVYGVDDPDGGLAGTLALTKYGDALAVIGMLLVAPRRARQGLARALTVHNVKLAAGVPIIAYTSAEGQHVCQRAGFRPVSRVPALIGRFRPGNDDLADRAGHVLAGQTRPAAEGDLEPLLEFDAEAFGADRGHLLRRLFTFTEQVRVLEAGGRISGYAAAWHDGSLTAMGPVVAADMAGAQALIADLSAAVDAIVRLDLHRQDLAQWCQAHGFWEVTSSTFMVNGAQPPSGSGSDTGSYAPVNLALG